MLKRCFLKSRLNVVLFVFFLPAFFITATYCWQIKPAAGQEAQKSCLWSIEGRSNKIHLLGSLHFFKPDAFPLAVSIEKAYAESERLVFETDLAAMQDPAVQARMMALGMYPEGQDLWRNLDLGTRQLLEKKIAEFELPLESFSRFKPWFAAVQIEIVQLMRCSFFRQSKISRERNWFFGVDRVPNRPVGQHGQTGSKRFFKPDIKRTGTCRRTCWRIGQVLESG
jgi:uncharacterized protein YbaP (TraB family)